MLYHLILEGRSDYLMDKAGDTITRTDVLSAAGDLRQAADQLKESAQAMTEAGHEDREALRLTLSIADASAAVQPVADQLTAALARFLAAPPEA